jgi:alanyl-tRNA synthetase
MKLLSEESSNLSAGQMLKGDIAFKLYDTYGFPLDLTTDILRERKIKVDEKGFNDAMEVQRETARKASTGSGDKKVNEVYFDLHNKFGATEFLGYDETNCVGKVLGLIVDNNLVKEISETKEFEFVTNQTCFYGESGGQTGDNGWGYTNNCKLEISDTKKYFGGLIVHKAKLISGVLKLDDQLELSVNEEDRIKLMANHSATHLLHAVLRKTYGEHVVQKGSLVLPDRFRFDFSSPKALSKEELIKVENEVNRLIRKNTSTSTRLMDIETALGAGAMALFGEKYGDEVRVVTMGEESKEVPYSVELCGGTHVHASGDIGYFKILSESAIAAGIRRIEAITGQAAIDYANKQEEQLNEVSALLKSSPSDLAEKIKKLVVDSRNLQKQIDNLKMANLKFDPKLVQKVGDVHLYCLELEEISSKDLRPIALDILGNMKSGVVCLVTKVEGKAGTVVAISDDLVKQASRNKFQEQINKKPNIGKFDAKELVLIVAKELGGEGGGGKENFAQAGGPNPNNAKKAIAALRKVLENSVKKFASH